MISFEHTLFCQEEATITGWLSPIAHFIEIDTIKVDGVTPEQIKKAAWEEDQILAKALAARKPGEAPPAHDHGHKH